jgi:hypothetical protein
MTGNPLGYGGVYETPYDGPNYSNSPVYNRFSIIFNPLQATPIQLQMRI